MPERAHDSVHELARFAAGLDIRTLPQDIVERAQAALLYGTSVGIASHGASAPRLAASALDTEGIALDTGGATRLLDGAHVPAGAAAFCNAVLMHARIQEDAHPAGHVGVVVVPAALAAAQRSRSSGAALLAALVAGYEVALRIGRDHAADTSARGFRTTPVYGVIGAAAAAARIERADPDGMLRAIALGANLACGLREFVLAGTGEFALHAGFAARNGMTAASLAAVGADAADSTIEGEAGFLRAYGAAGGDYARRIAADLGIDFEMRRVTVKPYPTCQFNREVIRGVLELRKRLGAVPLSRMDLHLAPFEADFVGMRYAGPFATFSQTFMSAPFCAALAWCSGAVTFSGMHEFDRPDVAALVTRVDVVADPERPRYRPRVRLKHERDDVWHEWTSDDSGDERYTLNWAPAVDAANTLLAEVRVPPDTARRLVDAVERLPSSADLSGLVGALRAAVAAAGAAATRPGA